MRTTDTSLTVLKTLLIGVLVIGVLYFARTFLIPLALAGVLASLFHPLCVWLERHKIGRMPAALISLLILLIILGAVTGLIWWQVAELSKDFEKIRQRITEVISAIQEFFYTHMGLSPEKQEKIMEDQQSGAGKMLAPLAGSIAAAGSGLLLTCVYMVLLIYYRRHIMQFLFRLLPATEKSELETVVHETAEVSHQYLFGLAKMIGCLWIMYGIGFSVIGINNAIFFAILCGLLEIIPFVGNITGTGITILVSAIQGGDTRMLGGIILVYGIVQLIQTWILEPLVVGPQVKINAFATIVALVAGELIWGIPGIILAIPLTGMFKIVCDHVTPLKPLGFLIGDTGDKKPSRFKTFFSGLFARKKDK